uniref:Uncharacterized protein n=1 Tax=Myotis myotis TaxID=51298 RepID=A0A7J7VYJ9_MYOMY|nr:hypothetical protein mMyoMyo1_012288 [Myotis myotis]
MNCVVQGQCWKRDAQKVPFIVNNIGQVISNLPSSCFLRINMNVNVSVKLIKGCVCVREMWCILCASDKHKKKSEISVVYCFILKLEAWCMKFVHGGQRGVPQPGLYPLQSRTTRWMSDPRGIGPKPAVRHPSHNLGPLAPNRSSACLPA